jgi:hypothetical protein
MKKKNIAKKKSDIQSRSLTVKKRAIDENLGGLKKRQLFLKSPSDWYHFATANFLGVFGGLAFGIQMWRTSFVLTTPSDPLQYVQPSLSPQNGFEFLDRTLLWLTLRLFSTFPFPREMVGPIATLSIVCLLIYIVAFWLAYRINYVSSGIFIGLAFINPFYISISTYTYPTQLMTLVIITTLILVIESRSFLLGGAGTLLAILSKVQGIALGITLFVFAFDRTSDSSFLRKIRSLVFGFLGASILIFSILIASDGFESTWRWIYKYFTGGTASTQFSGQNIKGVPDFMQYKYEPIALIAILGSLAGAFTLKQGQRIFAFAAISQTLFLILIYAISQRGGPLIHNYSFDALSLGLISFSILVGGLLSIRRTRSDLFLSLFISFICLFWTILEGNRSVAIAQIVIGQMFSNSSNLAFFGGFFFLLALFLYHSSNKDKVRSRSVQSSKNRLLIIRLLTILSLGLLIVASCKNVERGYSDSRFKREESLQYHNLGKLIRAYDGTICVDVKLGRPTNEDAGPRLRGIYITFYNSNPRNHLFINGLDSNGESLQGACDYFITDNDESKLLSSFDITLDGQSIAVITSRGEIVSYIDLPLVRVS